MATLLDSEAQFRQRAQECRLSDAALRDLNRLGITSFGLLAYSFGQPGQNIADEAFSTWVRQEVNQAITLADSAALKRLLFESHTLVMASLKEQVVAPDSAASKKVPATERDAKMGTLRPRNEVRMFPLFPKLLLFLDNCCPKTLGNLEVLF